MENISAQWDRDRAPLHAGQGSAPVRHRALSGCQLLGCVELGVLAWNGKTAQRTL